MHARGQGYRIRISTDSVNALKAVLTASEFEVFKKGTAETGGGGMHFLDGVTGEPVEKKAQDASKGNADADAPHGVKNSRLGGDVLGVARGFLRRELIRDLEDTVHWSKHITGYERGTDGVFAIFGNGSRSTEGSLLVAADGPQSAIAKQLTDGKVRAYDTGVRMIHGQTTSAAYKALGDGVWSVSDRTSIPGFNLGMITNVRPGSLDDPSLELGWNFIGSPGSFEPLDGKFSIQGKVAADLSRELTSKWHPKLRAIFEQQNDAEAAFLKMSTASPDGIPEWDGDSRVTVLGDAVHCMTPAGGVGANTALRDAALLGGMLEKGWEDGLTGRYEREMREYASENVKMSFEQASERFKIDKLR